MDLRAPCAKPRALVVDDDPFALRLLRDGLEGAGVEVLSASDGTGGLQQLVEHLLDLDLLVTDLNMPGLDGKALVRIIRSEGGERELPILVVAGTVSEEDRILLSRLGVTDIVEKCAGSDHIIRTAVRLATEARARQPQDSTAPTSETVPLASLRLRRARPA